jgi:phage-related tail fiber protein
LPAAAPDELTDIVLGQAYPDGTKIVGVQNDPAGAVGDPLQAYNNLSDVDDVAVARTNLDVFSKAETRQMAPSGLVAPFARNTAPTGWLKANGAAVSRVTYADLFAAIGTTFGAGDGFTTFNLPDLRGEFVRGWDDSRGVDNARAFGSSQKASMLYGERVNNTVNTISNVEISKEILGWDNVLVSNYSGATATRVGKSGNGDMTNNHVGGARPRNVALLYCIKF